MWTPRSIQIMQHSYSLLSEPGVFEKECSIKLTDYFLNFILGTSRGAAAADECTRGLLLKFVMLDSGIV